MSSKILAEDVGRLQLPLSGDVVRKFDRDCMDGITSVTTDVYLELEDIKYQNC
jgi:hypothetical protein